MNLYITDKTGKKFWNTQVSAGFAQGERNNMKRRLQTIQSGNALYAFVDAATAKIVEESEESDMSDDDLLSELIK